MISNLASVYLDVIQPYRPRIQVAGTPAVLQQTANQQKFAHYCYPVFAVQYFGVRSAAKRRHLVFGRKKMVEQPKLLARM